MIQKPCITYMNEMPEELIFECQRCGNCCKDLLQKDKGVLRGLTLLNEDISEFPKTSIKPAIGQGKRPYENSFKTIAHQLNKETCPHLRNSECKIYEQRPASCRQYPFSLREDTQGIQQIGLDLNCPALEKKIVNNIQLRFKFLDRPSAEKLLQIEKITWKNPKKTWFYDLSNEKWIRYDKLPKDKKN
jgi:Fe-S-cluster containining protein